MRLSTETQHPAAPGSLAGPGAAGCEAKVPTAADRNSTKSALPAPLLALVFIRRKLGLTGRRAVLVRDLSGLGGSHG